MVYSLTPVRDASTGSNDVMYLLTGSTSHMYAVCNKSKMSHVRTCVTCTFVAYI